MKKERYFLRGCKNFAIKIFAFFVSLVFGVIYPSCSCLPCVLSYVVSCMSPSNISAAWHTIYYQAMYQESNSLKKTLCIVFVVAEHIATFSSWWFCLLLPRFGTTHWKDLMAYRGDILWNTVKALLIKNKGVFWTFKTDCRFCLNYAP